MDVKNNYTIYIYQEVEMNLYMKSNVTTKVIKYHIFLILK